MALGAKILKAIIRNDAMKEEYVDSKGDIGGICSFG